ncbi:hypothetical protein Tco_0503089, partial [Tanacetum coccineum]
MKNPTHPWCFQETYAPYLGFNKTTRTLVVVLDGGDVEGGDDGGVSMGGCGGGSEGDGVVVVGCRGSDEDDDDGEVERAKHKREYDRRMNDRMMQSKEGKVDSSKALDASLVVTESNETESERHVSSIRSGKDTHAEDADINSVNDKQPMAEVQLFAEHNIRANEQQHAEQSKSVYDTYVLEKVDRNTIPKSTDM